MKRRQLEEIVLCTLLNQLRETQFKFLMDIGSNIMLSQREKEYYDKKVLPTMQENYAEICRDKAISEQLLTFAQKYFPPNFFILKLYNEKKNDASSVTDDEFNEIMHYYTSNAINQYDNRYIKFLFDIIESEKSNNYFIERFYDDIYMRISHFKKVSLMSHLRTEKRTALMDRICVISELKGLPGIVYDIPDSSKMIQITIMSNGIEKTRKFNKNDTVYSLILFASLAFNINFCLFHLEFQQGKITEQDSHLLLNQFIPEETSKVKMALIPNKGMNINIEELYYLSDHQLRPQIEDLVLRWRNSFGNDYYIAKEHFFPHLHTDTLFSPILKQFFIEYSKISKEEFMQIAKACAKDFCIFHLIVGFNEDKTVFLKNTSYYEMPRVILTNSQLSNFDQIIKVKKKFKRIPNAKLIQFLISEFYFYATKKSIPSTGKVFENIKELYKQYSEIESDEEYKLYKLLLNKGGLSEHIHKLFLVYALYIKVATRNIHIISNENIGKIWELFYKCNTNDKECIIDDFLNIFSKLPSISLKSDFVDKINKSLLANNYSFVCSLLKEMLSKTCFLNLGSQANIINLFKEFDSSNTESYQTVLFYYGYYYPDKIDIKDKAQELLRSAYQLNDNLYRLSVYYCLSKAKQLEPHQASRDNGVIKFYQIELPEKNCCELLKEKGYTVIANELFKKNVPEQFIIDQLIDLN